MLERIVSLPAGIDGVKAVGKVSQQDYQQVFEPLIDEARRANRRLRLLYQFGPEFDGFTAGGVWEDASIGLRSLRLIEGLAIVSDIGWIRDSSRLLGFFMPGPVRHFGNGQLADAVAWLQALPDAAGVTHRLLADRGVIVAEVTQALRARDFDELAVTADSWIEAHGQLQGLVIHARRFPGWENLGGLIRHVRFVRDHHRKIKRIAIAADGELATLAPRLGEHFIQAEVKSFAYDALDSAIAWASGV
ncbi:MAG TPA: STAS/SEC14 domain-containing protein [Gemmatimonadaceae bacterium]|nr:STAS/SEC14 domain-containing protein [Gemmatimonadaceae bacterium]